MNRITKIVKTFETIAKPHKNMEKQNEIMELLKEFNPKHIEGMGIVLSNITKGTRKNLKVVVSHFDLVNTFEKGFEEGRTLEFTEDGVVNGALDNTITNAVLINELLKNGLPENTIILFSDGEETGMWGMRRFIMNMEEHMQRMFFINLDVTNDNWEYMTSIEYDKPNKEISKMIDNNITAGFTTDRFADDMSPVISAGGDGFSYCLPTKEYCHTYHSNTTIEHLLEYEKGLTYLVQKLDIQNKEPDGSVYVNSKIA